MVDTTRKLCDSLRVGKEKNPKNVWVKGEVKDAVMKKVLPGKKYWGEG